MVKFFHAFVVNLPSNTIVLHVSRNSTAIEAREKAVAKKAEKKDKKRRGWPKKGKTRLPPPENKMEKMLEEKDHSCYSLMDAGYDAAD
ncbi:hypothetical protein FACS189491_12230 [Spirochaetia bacterium]|nr:hypothetical protein FACS189491_12230 [Spirochaetia bacterium]